MASWLKISCLSLALAVLMLSGCTQGKGDVCQVKADCDDGLVCNSSLGVCESAPPSTDAAPVPDNVPDAAPVPDNVPDAAPVPDAVPDAAPVPDAAL